MPPLAIAPDRARRTAANNALLDFVAALTCAKNDAMLARTLCVTPPTISKIRHGRIPIGAAIQLTMLEFCGLTLAQLRHHLPRHRRAP